MSQTTWVSAVLLLCMAVWIPRPTQGFAILAEENAIVSTNNGTLHNNKTVVLLFAETDFDVTFVFTVLGTDGVNRGMNIEAPAIGRDYTGQTWGFSPAISNLHISENCNVKNTIRYNSSLPSYLFQQPVGRQLQSVWDSITTGFKTFTCTGGFGYLQSFASAGLAVAAASGNNFCGGGGVSQDSVDSLKGNFDDLSKKTRALENAQSVFFGNLTTLIGDIAATNAEFLKFQSAQLTANNALQSQINQTTQAIVIITNALTSQNTAILNDIARTNQNIIDLAAQVAVGFTGQTQTLANYMVQFMGFVNATNVRIQNLTSVVNDNQKTTLTLLRANARNTRNLATNLQTYILNTGTIIAQTQNLQAYIQEDQAGGVFTPFLDDLGSKPLGTPQNLGQFKSLPFEPISRAYTWINPADGQPWATITTREYVCSALYAVTNPYTAVTSQDITEFVGGNVGECSTTVEGARFCNCWIEWQEQMCPIITSSSGIADPTVYANFRATMTAGVTTIDPAFCNGGAPSIVNTGPLSTPSGVNGIISNSLDAYINTTTIYASRHTCSDATGGSNCVDQGYSDWDAAGRKRTQVNWDIRTTQYGAGFTASIYGTDVNAFTADLDWFTQAYQFILTYIDTYQDTVFGSPPDDVTQVFIPFRRDPVTGSPMSCSRWSYIAVPISPTDWVPINVMQPVGVRASVIVTVDGNPNIQSSFVISNPNTNLLPDYQPQVGDFLSTTTQYNPGVSEIVISPNPVSREGKITYIVFGAIAQASVTVWQTINLAIFNHEAAANAPSQYENDIDPDTGACIPIQTANITVFNGGNWCALRNNFIVSPDPVHNIATYFGRHDQMIANVIVPEGQITQLQQSACPQIVESSLQSDGTTLLTLQNLLSGALPNAIPYKIISNCPEVNAEVTINPLSTKQLIIPFCALNDPGQSTDVYFFISGAPPTQCPQVLNITASLASIGTVTGPGSLQLTEVLRTKTSDTVLNGVGNIQTSSNIVLLQIATALLNLATYVPIPEPELFINNITMLLQSIVDIQNNAQTVINDTRLQGVNYTQLVTPNLEIIAQQQAIFTQAQADALAAHIRAAILVNKTSADLQTTTRAMYAYLNASVEFFEANLAFDAQVLRIFQEQVDSGGNLDFLGDFFGILADAGTGIWNALSKIPEAVADFFGSTLGGLLNSLGGGIFTMIGLCAGIAALGLGLYLLITQCTGGGAAAKAATTATVMVPIKTSGRRKKVKVTLEQLYYVIQQQQETIDALSKQAGIVQPAPVAAGRLLDSDGDDDEIELSTSSR